MGVSGKTIVLAAAALALGALSSSAAWALDDVRLRLNWMYYGSHAGFALGKDKGYFHDAGINLDIRSGNGSGPAPPLLAHGARTLSHRPPAPPGEPAAPSAPPPSL